MDNMDIDSPPEVENNSINNNNNRLKPRDRILRRLSSLGIPSNVLDQLHSGLVAYVRDNKTCLPEVVTAILPSDDDVREAIVQSKSGSRQSALRLTMKDQFRESMVWLEWLMFEGDPRAALRHLADRSVGQRGVCGAVWGSNDIAYRCRTCEHDPTCAICVPCFQNGNHKDHDYSIIYTSGGCCDCGDVTAWKREGFCSKHRGAEQIQSLPEEFVKSVGLVLDSLFIFWRDKLQLLESSIKENPRASGRVAEHRKYANEMTFAVVEVLLEFCKYSESLLSFISSRVRSFDGFLGVLVTAEGMLMESVVKKLHELLLKLLAEPVFKYEFAKVFLSYYPVVISDTIKEFNDEATLKKYPLLSTFSVQIFTVPTLTPQLVKEMSLLHTLLGCLGDILNSCCGDDGRLQLSKLANIFEITYRVVEDIRFVMSHDVVPRYVMQFQRDVVKTWMRLLAFVQEMNPQKRETGIHIEEENEHTHLPFILCNSIHNIHSVLVNGVYSVTSNEKNDEIILESDQQDMDDEDSHRHAKVGRLSQESSAGITTGRSIMLASSSKTGSDIDPAQLLIPPSVALLSCECLRAIERGLLVGSPSGSFNGASQVSSSVSAGNFLAWKKTFTKFGRGKNIFGRLSSSSEDQPGQSSSTPSDMHYSQNTGLEKDLVNTCCSTDPAVDASEFEYAAESGALRILSTSDWPDVVYDVSSQEVSVHIPLHRLLSLLLQKALRRCYSESTAPSITNDSSCSALSTDLFSHLLAGCHPSGFSAFIMEHPLRIRVFFAEVHAGMWRKNGDAPLVSWECYRSIRWSGLDLDLDLFLLQCCASMASADDYVTRILERFGLSTYLSLNPQQSNEYEPALVQEMLTLIIQIVKERRFCGFSTAENLQRELVCKLATGDATRSQLVKSLPRDLSKADELQRTLDTVAQYSNPSGFNQGTYSLRRVFWKELDLYHPRWNLRDLQLAEERYSRYCNAFALTTQLPRWTPVYYPLRGVARLATCKAVLRIIRAVVFYAVFTGKATESRASDGVVLTALHLLSLGLDICNQHRGAGDRSCYTGDVIPLLAFAGEEIDMALLNDTGGHSLLSLLVLLMRTHKRERLDSVLEAGNYNLSALIEGLLKKFAEMDTKCMTKLHHLAPEVVSHLVQPFPGHGRDASDAVSDTEKRKAKARERQAAILEKMKAEQSKFLKSLDTTSDDDLESGEECDVRLDSEESTQDVCSLCHDSNSRVPVSYLILLQKSRLLTFINRGPLSWEHAQLSDKNQISTGGKVVNSQPLMDTSSRRPEGASSHVVQDDKMPGDSASQRAVNDDFGPTDCDGIYLSSCGHAVHQGCLDRYLSSLKERYVRRVIFEGGHIVDPDQGEFLCPVCRRLANSVLPALPTKACEGNISSTDAAALLTMLNAESHCLRVEQAVCLLKWAANRKDEILRSSPVQSNGKVRPDLEPVSRMLCKMYFPEKQDEFVGSSRVDQSIIMWDTLKYSLVLTEIGARCGRKSLTPNLGVEALYREFRTSSEFVLSLLVKVVQSTHNGLSSHEIQRLRGMELLAESICSGRSLDHPCNSSGNANEMLSFLGLTDTDMTYPDVQFWNRASDPILARDPFSSFMWVLFCLPYQFLSSKEAFQSLVHLFYLVSVSQAILVCLGKFQHKVDELDFDGCLITDILEVTAKFPSLQQYFVSNYIDESRNVKDTMRSLSFPFLRRCALLWELLQSSSTAPFHRRGEVMDNSSHATSEMTDSESEHRGFEEMQNMFRIPSLDVVLNDKSISPLLLRWCHHFSQDFEKRSFHDFMNVTPAVPFRLMELPSLYQDLLERCVKQRCPDCKALLVEPALCLLCGKLCSPSWKSCCRQSGCQSHAMACGAGTCVFLLIRRTTILLQRSARQAPWPSPYLDAFGEEDIEMKRGKPLYLNEERYAALTYMVASHGLDRSSEVLRQTTISSFFLV